MTTLEVLFAAWGSVASLAWLRHYAGAMRGGGRLPWLARREAREPAEWPSLAVVVPARDESGELPAALASLLDQSYPDLRIVLVDDRSSDATGAIMDEHARKDSRVRVLHVRELPEGWLGKVHALEIGLAAARSDWVLFTDADVRFRPRALETALSYALEQGLDHLTLTPEVETSSFWQEVLIVTFGSRFLQRTRAARVGRGDSQAFVGVGAFNLVKRETFERTPGFSWLRLEVLDDVGLGLMIRRAGGRSALGVGQGLIVLRWYASVGAMVRGLEKNMFAVLGRYRLGRAFALAFGMVALEAGPFLALAQPWLPARLAAGAALGVLVLFAAAVRATTGRHFFATLAMPLGVTMLAWTLVRSAVVCRWRGGVSWRETFYPLAVLRAGQRVRL